MLENIPLALKIGVGILLTVAIIVVSVVLFNQGQTATKNTEQDMKGINQVLTSQKYDAYNGTPVSGSNVINAIHMYSANNNLTITVTTGTGAAAATTVYKSGTSTADYAETNINAGDYINPSASFNSLLITNSAHVVTGITFTQQ